MAKWLDIATQTFTDLSAHGPLVALLSYGVDSIEPILGDRKIGEMFLTYHAVNQASPSKDTVFEFNVVIRAYAKTYNKAAEIADAVIDAIGESQKHYKPVGGTPGFTDENEFYIEQTFNIKK